MSVEGRLNRDSRGSVVPRCVVGAVRWLGRGVSRVRQDVPTTGMDPRPDTELLAAALAGDGEAFGAFYRRHARRIAAFPLARTRKAQDAAALTAETFAVALEALDR